MTIIVKYFASMREATDLHEEILETDAKDPSELFKSLSLRYNFLIKKEHLKVAVNETYVSFEEPLKDGDVVVFIPPVAGG